MPDLSAILLPLLAWYDRARRTLPWRAQPGTTPDPYHVWLSEIMLQQTSVAAVTPRFAAFLARFPTLAALAEAEEHAVLRQWAGLGYYARARNLHRCAQHIATLGTFPSTQPALHALPGIGAYTATAIAAIAFAVPGIPIDANVERILCRLAAIPTPPAKSRPLLAALATTLAATPPATARPSDTAQALFDLGATICTAATPACTICPIRPHCAASLAGLQNQLPARTPRPTRPIRHGTAFYLQDEQGRVLLRRRPSQGLLGGMNELPGTPWAEAPLPPAEALTHAPTTAPWRPAGIVRHVFTHFELRLTILAAQALTVPGAILLSEAALPTLMRKAADLGRTALK